MAEVVADHEYGGDVGEKPGVTPSNDVTVQAGLASGSATMSRAEIEG